VRLQLGPRKVIVEDRGPRLQELRNPRAYRIELDAGDVGEVAQRGRHQGREETAANARLKYPAASEAEPLNTGPDGANNVFRREVRILVTARERCRACVDDLELFADVFPTLAECSLARAPKNTIGEFGSAEADEMDELRLLLSGRRTMVGLDLGCEADGGEIALRAIAPALSERAVANEMEILT
jgi:hypothetical protein